MLWGDALIHKRLSNVLENESFSTENISQPGSFKESID